MIRTHELSLQPGAFGQFQEVKTMTPATSAEDINKPSGGPVGQPGYIELYSGWVTTQKGGFLYGRVHQGKPLPLPEEGDGLEVKLHQTFQDLDVHALSHAQVRLSGLP